MTSYNLQLRVHFLSSLTNFLRVPTAKFRHAHFWVHAPAYSHAHAQTSLFLCQHPLTGLHVRHLYVTSVWPCGAFRHFPCRSGSQVYTSSVGGGVYGRTGLLVKSSCGLSVHCCGINVVSCRPWVSGYITNTSPNGDWLCSKLPSAEVVFNSKYANYTTCVALGDAR